MPSSWKILNWTCARTIIIPEERTHFGRSCTSVSPMHLSNQREPCPMWRRSLCGPSLILLGSLSTGLWGISVVWFSGTTEEGLWPHTQHEKLNVPEFPLARLASSNWFCVFSFFFVFVPHKFVVLLCFLVRWQHNFTTISSTKLDEETS